MPDQLPHGIFGVMPTRFPGLELLYIQLAAAILVQGLEFSLLFVSYSIILAASHIALPKLHQSKQAVTVFVLGLKRAFSNDVEHLVAGLWVEQRRQFLLVQLPVPVHVSNLEPSLLIVYPIRSLQLLVLITLTFHIVCGHNLLYAELPVLVRVQLFNHVHDVLSGNDFSRGFRELQKLFQADLAVLVRVHQAMHFVELVLGEAILLDRLIRLQVLLGMHHAGGYDQHRQSSPQATHGSTWQRSALVERDNYQVDLQRIFP
mmetsp:Transcript_80638/g.145579  ORF Transcript_80638/g.145579 Transcript_80638/m.145579 type:complete len:260 (+) Transcript_80638:76-855(+)